MPARYVDMDGYGYGVKFPKKPLIDKETRKKLKSLKLYKKPYAPGFEQVYTGTKPTIQQVLDFIETYNLEYYEQ